MLLPATTARADAAQAPPGPDRVTPIQVDYTAYTWWMATYDDNSLECEIVIDHEGMPTSEDVLRDCGESIWFDYKEQPPCYTANHPRKCEGYYVYLVDTQTAQREMTVKLPPAVVWLSLEGCSPVSRARHQRLRGAADARSAGSGTAAERADPAHRRHGGRHALHLRSHLQDRTAAHRLRTARAWSSGPGRAMEIPARLSQPRCAWPRRAGETQISPPGTST